MEGYKSGILSTNVLLILLQLDAKILRSQTRRRAEGREVDSLSTPLSCKTILERLESYVCLRRFWKVWRGFEVQHGNEDTWVPYIVGILLERVHCGVMRFRDMLRIKRSVQAMFSQAWRYMRMHCQLLTVDSNSLSRECH